ncbi:DUF6603 domain-containing protein [Cylindrospermum sp. FACHB-282]|uniref:DUF6603 domain-containing protein n=1 Tax=Cylindrospermum sp. FACHB-282 TaxID=2692794 RepID=UPI00168A3123|nr:DUF6603 domain-containing protein [Cylindrospermum sp. FACHB-282]MBD2385023.1 hypothetical protein [Cylindrospermum sp. FACHB-282]
MSNPILQPIKTQLELGALTLDRNTIGSALANQLQQAFSGEVLKLEEVQQPIAETDNYLYFQAMIPSLLRVRLQTVEGIFFVSNGQLECLLKATLPNVWDFSWSYPDLPEYTNFGNLDPEAGNQPSLFYDLRFPDRKPMVLVFSSYNFQEDRTPQSHLTLLDATLDVTKIHRGLNFISEIALSEIPLLAILMDFAGYTDLTLPFYGYLNQEPEYEEIRLEIELNFNKTYEDIFSFGISLLVLHTSVSLYADYTGSGISFLGGVAIGTSQTAKSVELLWPVGSTQLIVKNAEPISFPGFDTFANLLRGHLPDDSDTFPLEITSLSTIEIRELSLQLSLIPPMVSQIVLSVGPTEDWNHSLLGQALTIEDLLLRWEVNPGDPTPIRFYILSAFNVGGGLVNVSAVFPDFAFYGELGLYQTIALDQVIEEIIPNARLPQISILDLAISADIKQGLYAFEIEMASDWELDLGGASILPLKYLHLSLEKNPDGSFATINSVMTIAGVDLILLATNANESSAGWTFAGSTRPGQEIPIGLLIEDLATTFGIKDKDGGTDRGFPKAIEGLVIENIATYFNTDTKDFYFTCESVLEIEEEIVDVIFKINITRQPDGFYNKHFQGHIIIGNFQFDLIFDEDNRSESFIATYSHQTGNAIPLRALVENLSSDQSLLDILEGIEVDLKDVLFAYNKRDTVTKILFGLDIGTSINLSKLPLVGKEFTPEQNVGVDDSQLLIASQDFTSQEITTFNNLIPENVTKIPESPTTNNAANNETTVALPKGLNVAAKMQFGSTTDTLALPVSAAATQPTSPNQPALPAPTSTSTSDNATWFKLQKSFGPVQFERVGVQYKDAVIWFLLDAALSVAGLTLSLEGLSVGSALSKFEPKFNLRGLGLDYKSGPIQIGGAFLKGKITFQGKEYDDYSGTALIRTSTLTLAAIGSYVQLDMGPSMFVYAVLDYPIGGPAFFFVRGLAAGFGYNRLLHLPPVDQIDTFPLVQEAVGSLAGTPNLADELAKLQQYIPPSVGNYFLAIGIRFTSFEMIDSFILVTATFGHRFELDVVGLSTLVLPAADAESAGVTPIAEVQLALRATFIPDDGFFGISAQLTRNSFLLSRRCQLTGGFAFYTWFSGTYEGDFVLTVGGYHPQFSRPSHYPTVPRLGFNWQVNDQVTFKGSAYYALTPSTLMAGASLNATWQDGNLQAWFDAAINFLISWKPYHYSADFHVSIGASYTFHFFGTHHITAHVGADVSIWGPEFSGKAHVDLSIISFTIRFGSSGRNEIEPIAWETFRQSFLPDDKAKLCTINLKAGLTNKAAAKDSTDATTQPHSDNLGVVNPKTFCLTTDSVIPAKQVYRGTQDQNTLDHTGATVEFNIGTMQLSNNQIISTQRMIITRDGNSVEEMFDFYPLTKNAPAALWGRQIQPSLQGDQLINNLLTGYEIRVKRLDDAPHTEPISYAELQQAATLDREPDAFHWSSLIPFIPQGADNPTARRETIRNTLYNNDIAGKRAAIARAFLGDESLNLANFSADDFLSAPQVN